MANLVRVTGKCGIPVVDRVRSSKDGKEYTFHSVPVIVAASGVSVLRFDPERNGRTFGMGDEVDVLANADLYGQRPTLDYVADYPHALRRDEAESLLTSAE